MICLCSISLAAVLGMGLEGWTRMGGKAASGSRPGDKCGLGQ